ncbi:hypothetical protein [Fluviicola sp.]|uniref:hypothetical protein n=1 Tax=Fluviicola sp. TaxID=1917219 RepID=UPI0031DBDED0
MKVCLFSLSFLLFSCSSSNSEVKEIIVKEKVEDSVSNSCKAPFQKFWTSFARSLENSDTIALNNLLDDTVLFYGREDRDPRFDLTKKDRIMKVLDIYNTGGFYDDNKDLSVSYKDFFQGKESLNEYRNCKDEQEIKDFVFRKTAGGEWKLILVYCNTNK